MDQMYALAVFRSRQHTLLFEKKLKEAGLSTSIVNTPHEIAIGCGVSVRFIPEEYRLVRLIYDRNRQVLSTYVGLYTVQSDGTRLRCIPINV